MADLSGDYDLLRRYVEHGSDSAFATLVQRHTAMVYAAACRQLGHGGPADEVTQAAFILLMRKAHLLPPGTVVAGWLYNTVRYAAANARRAEQRRRKHEHKAADMRPTQTTSTSTWAHVAPHLDEAIAGLGELDRAAVVLRFLERRSMAEVGDSLGVSEHAAQMRVSRALDKLRHFFRRRGLTLSATTLGVLITTHANAAAPPAGVATSLTMAALRAAAGPPPAGGHLLADAVARRTALRQATRVTGVCVAAVLALGLLTTGARLAVQRLPDFRPAAKADDAPPQLSAYGLTDTPAARAAAKNLP